MQMPERQKRVLIVDDEEDLTWTLSKKLSKDSDKFDVMCVNSGREAIEVLNQVPFDLVITDVRMPEVSGLELLTRWKTFIRLPKWSSWQRMTIVRCEEKCHPSQGCFNYIEKPFEINELRRQILEALEQKKGFKGSVSDFQLSDIIQLNCYGRISSGLRVICDDEVGMIFFQEGNIVHAETPRFEGESVLPIMSWQGGEFQVMRNQLPPRETITRGWQSLLLESLRWLDESSDLAKQEAEREKQRRQNRLKTIVEKICNAENVEHVLIHSRAGFPLFMMGIFRNARKLSAIWAIILPMFWRHYQIDPIFERRATGLLGNAVRKTHAGDVQNSRQDAFIRYWPGRCEQWFYACRS